MCSQKETDMRPWHFDFPGSIPLLDGARRISGHLISVAHSAADNGAQSTHCRMAVLPLSREAGHTTLDEQPARPVLTLSTFD